jgi:phosphatidylethanolamine-binding protein (PEBP) family uncharacterized protein
MFRPTNTVALSLSLIGLGLLGACSSTTTPPGGTGGATASGGTVGSGGASGGTASGGTSSGGVSSGGSASGGVGTGGVGTGGVGTGGSGGGSTGGSGGGSSGGSGGGGSEEFLLTVEGLVPFGGGTTVDNDDCDADAEATCPLFPQENVSTAITGDNISPAMSWPEGPEGTLSYAVILRDLTFPNAHWALWDIPAGTLALPEGLPTGATLTTPIMGKQAGIQGGYFGSGACGNVYEFKLYALDTATLDVGGATMAAAVITALEAADALDTSFARVQSREYCD